MKYLFVSFLAFASVSSFAQNSVESSGFKIKNDTATAMKLVFQKSQKIIISKARFENEKQASDFCKGEKSKLDKEFTVMLIAMSGAATNNKFLEESIVFKINNTSGIWQWSGTGNTITAMFDGRGSETESISASELKKYTTVALPAICVGSI